MRVTSLTNKRLVVTAICGAAVALVLGASRARADETDKRTVITVNQPMQVTDQLLQPGKYVFLLVGGNSDRYTDRDTVEIFNANQTRVIDTVVAVPTYRVEPTGKAAFTFWETPPGTARALRDWYYAGDNYGREFPYPKHPTMLAEVHTWTPTPTPAPMAATLTPTPAPVPQANAEPAPQPPAQVAEAAPAPAPEPAPAPAALPKTASLYPTIGLVGLLLVGFYGLLRLRRTT
jgi:hypothetical protein